MAKEKSWTLQLNQPVRYMTSMSEKEQAYYISLILSYIDMVLEKKFNCTNFFHFRTCKNNCPNEEDQNENQPDISSTHQNANF